MPKMNCAALLIALIITVRVRFSVEDCRVLVDCDGETTPVWKYLPAAGANSGRPGKRGSTGPKGERGEQGVGVDGRHGNKGQKGEPGRGINLEIQDGPIRYDADSSMTWIAGKERCRNLGKNLCSSRDLCVDNNNDKQLVIDVIQGDCWVPVNDGVNEWLEVGDSQVRTCRLHRAHHGSNPPWGLATEFRQFRRFLFCCGQYDVHETYMRYQYTGKGTTYPSSVRHCNRQGLRLCAAAEVCEGNRPAFGVVDGDAWVAVNDKYNEWIQVGNHLNRNCWVHGIKFGLPPWGTRTNGQLVAHVGYVYCCS